MTDQLSGNAIKSSDTLKAHNTEVFLQGSYANKAIDLHETSYYVEERRRSVPWIGSHCGGQDCERTHPIILAGRNWEIQEIDWKGRKVYVAPSESGEKCVGREVPVN